MVEAAPTPPAAPVTDFALHPGTPPVSWILTPTKPPAPTASHPAILSLEVFLDDQPTLRGHPESAAGTDLSGTVSLALAGDLDVAETVSVQLYGAATRAALEAQAALVAADDTVPSYASSPPDAPALSALKSAHTPVHKHGSLSSMHSTSSAASSSSKAGARPPGTLDDADMVYCSSHDVWHHGRLAPPLTAGAHEFRFLFKIPGSLPATDAALGVRYVLRCLIAGRDGAAIAAMVEEVRIRRLGLGGAVGDEEEGPLPAYGDEPPEGIPPPEEFGDEPPAGNPPEDMPPGYAESWKGKSKLM
ncbi:hypothetical protein HDU96_009745 [Phlyctochytrium bullatum]|nr:hypothetical protein HDU96_009745 [Phlyctochytrium bullatum]